VEFGRGSDISVFMLNILTVMDNYTIWPDYFLSDFVGLYCSFIRNKFRARTAFTSPSLSVELVLEGNILLYIGVLGYRLNEYMGLESWANMANGRP
jgi:hypothetical protein